MKKLFFILALFVFTATFAQVMTPEELDEYYSSSQSFFNGLLTANIEFSQDKYNVGDSIDVKIYFQVDSSKNIENYKFAIPKPSDWYIYLLIRGRTKIEENLTDELINDIRTEYNDKNNLIYCDSELILDNNNPTGYYHLSYKVPQKVSPQKILGKYSNVITRNVSIFKYKNVKRYNGFNDYGSYMRETEDNDDYYAQCRVNIKIADKSLKAPNLNKIEFGDNKKASINREVKLFQAKKVDHNQNLRDRLTQEVLSDKTTHCALAPEPHTIEGYSPNLGTIAIDNYEPFGSYNSIRIDANDNPDFCGLVQYRDVNNELYEFYIILTDNYFLGGEVKIFKSQGSPGTPDIYVPAIGVMQKINENGEVLAQTGIDNGTYFLNDFAPDDDIRYAAITSTAMILEKDAVNVIVNNSAFGLDPQTVYYLINEDNFQLNISFRPASQVFEDGVYYLQNQQIIYSNKLFDSQMRAESFSVNSLSNNQRELLLIYGDIDVNHPGLGNSGFVPVELEPGLDYDYDFVHIESSDLANTSIALHELGHAHHWHHAGFSLANRVQHSWTGSYSKELAWREGFATFFSSLVRKNTSPLFFDSPTSYLIYSSKNVEIPTGLPKGNNCEGAVCGFLWDLYD